MAPRTTAGATCRRFREPRVVTMTVFLILALIACCLLIGGLVMNGAGYPDALMGKCIVAEPGRTSLSLFTSGLNDFTERSYKSLEDDFQNLVYCPYSLSTVLSMLYLGAKRQTKEQLKNGLSYPCDEDIMLDASEELSKAITEKTFSGDGSKVKVANKIYVHQNYEISNSFRHELSEHFGAQPEVVDFSKTDESVKKINDFVEQTTTIKDFVPSNAVSAVTKMVLVNAIYFKAKWKHPFDPKLTQNGRFYLDEDEAANVPLMKLTANLPHGEFTDLGAKVLELPYSGDEMSMYIVLPNKRTGLKDVEENLFSQIDFKKLDDQLTIGAEVTVVLPKFRTESSLQLDDNLKQLGVVDLFDSDKSDLSGISTANDLAVTAVIQKAFVDVSEEGTEAGAASGVFMAKMSLAQTKQFVCDHPFMFFIKHNKSGAVLFIGKIMNPFQ